MFGAATDYALLLVSRYREELRDTPTGCAAMRVAWRATLEPIAASAGTVILGVLCLLFSDLNSNRASARSPPSASRAALLAALTFLPAVLALLGRAAFWPFRPRIGLGAPASPAGSGAGSPAGRPRGRALVWIVTALVLLVGAAFLPQLQGVRHRADRRLPHRGRLGRPARRCWPATSPAGTGSPR